MPFNLFDQISWQSSVNSFLWNPQKPSTPQFGNFPTTPKTQTYKQPNQSIKPQGIIPQAQAGQPIVSDDEIKQMIDAGATDSEIETMIAEIEKERTPKQDEKQPDQSFMQKVWWALNYVGEGIQNITWWVIAETPKIAWNIFQEASKLWQYNPVNLALTWIKAWIDPNKTYWDLRTEQKKNAEKLWTAWQAWKEFVQKYWAYNSKSIWAKVWEIWSDIVSTIVWPWKVFKTAQEAGKAIKLLAWVANTSLEWTTAAVTNYVATEWRLPTAKEVGEFIALQWWVKVIGWVAWQIKKLPSARLIPTTITEAGKDIRKGIDIWEAISKTGISFTKWQLIGKIEKKVTSLSNSIDKKIWDFMKEKWPNNMTISEITKGIRDFIMKDAAIAKQLQWTPIQKQWIMDSIDETIDAYKKLYWPKKFDIAWQQQLKKDIYTWLSNTFNKTSPTAKITAEQATERQIARNLRANIETKIPEVGKLNKELSPFMEASKRLNAKGGYSGYLTDILAGWFASWSPTGIIDDPVWYMKNFALWVLTKRLWTSTLAKTTASTILRKTEQLFENKSFQKLILDQYRANLNQQ